MSGWDRKVKPRKGYVYRTPDAEITVMRVARDGSWADIMVQQHTGAQWTKRQPLQDGLFAFEPVIWSMFRGAGR
jgi:hypothetical protein